MPRLPHAAVEMVKEKFSTLTLYVLTQQTSADGSMTKLLISFRDAVTLNEEIDDAAGKLKLLILSMK